MRIAWCGPCGLSWQRAMEWTKETESPTPHSASRWRRARSASKSGLQRRGRSASANRRGESAGNGKTADEPSPEMTAAHRELAIRKSALQAIRGLPGSEEEVEALKARIASLQREITGLKPLATQIKVLQQATKNRQTRLEKAKAEEQQALEKYNYLRGVTNECLQDFKSCQEELEELQQQAEMEEGEGVHHDGYEVDQRLTFQQAVATTARQWKLSDQLQAAIQAELNAQVGGDEMVDVMIATPPRRAQGGLRSPTASLSSASVRPSPTVISSPESPRSAEIRQALGVTTAEPTQEYEEAQEEEEVEEYGDQTLFHEPQGHGLPPGAATPVGSVSPVVPLQPSGPATTAFRSSSRHAPYPGAKVGM